MPPLKSQPHSTGPEQASALVKRYCLGCHNDKVTTAGISLSGARPEAVASQADEWEKVLRKVRGGEMPPAGLPRPAAAVTRGFTHWLEGELDRAAIASPNPGTPAIHRLNRAEYSNAIRDLLALDLDHAEDLPADDSGYGFDNIGDVLTVSPLHLEKYMATARRVSRLAVGTLRMKPAVERYNPDQSAEDALDKLPLGLSGGMLIRRYFPLDAEYSIRVRVGGNPGSNLPAPRLDLRLDGKRVELFEVNINPAEEAQDSRNYEVRIPVTAGLHEIGAGFLAESGKPETGVVSSRRGFGPNSSPANIAYLLIGGPFNPKGPGDTASQRRIFVCRPESPKAEGPCAEKILSTLARRAYRRPVTQEDLKPLLTLFQEGRKDGGSFESGIEMALRAMLVSPNFLYRVEKAPAGSKPGGIRKVTSLELASRLSFFLWSSIPDEELLQLGEKGRLSDSAVLEQQVRRMLADPKARALVKNFAGQWLHLRNVASWSPDPEKYPGFNDSLRAGLQRETELLFEHIMREDRPVLDFIAADYTFLNERVARHYGMNGVRGDFFRKVSLDDPTRGGILTHGSILTVTSYPTRTSPVLRGKWILENVLGAPPPPPPPDVPNLSDSADLSAKGLREALETHRANAACASCHAQLDPLGFALENYDAIGKFRLKDGDVEIDASGALPEGTIVNGPGDLKRVLMERRDDFVECFAEKLLTYALGRGLEYYDLPAVRHVRREASAKDYRFSSIVLSIVNSVPFQMRRIPEQ